MSQEIQNINTPFLEEIKKNSGLTIAIGVIVLLMGFFAMGSPLIAGLSVTLMVGVMLIIGGIAQLVFAIKSRSGIFAIIIAVFMAIVGVYMIMNPAAALASLTIFLAAYLIMSGIFEALLAFQVKPAKGWGWELFNGIISLLLGAMIWNQFPISGAWAIGILFGVKLLFSGWTLIMFGLAARGMATEASSTAWFGLSLEKTVPVSRC